MDLENIQPIINEPALFIKNKKILVIADLHIGIESELKEKGLNIDMKTQKIIDHILRLIKKFKPKEIILLGDVKHNIPSTTNLERRDVKNFLATIQGYVNIHIIPGNHDGNIRYLCPEEIVVHPSEGYIVDNVGFFHGHRWPSREVISCDMVIMGHTHPNVILTDRLGVKNFENCWVRGKFKKDTLIEKYQIKKFDTEILIMPAFNPLCGGISVNREGIIGPVGRIIDLNNSDIYLIDGTFIGKIKNIK